MTFRLLLFVFCALSFCERSIAYPNNLTAVPPEKACQFYAAQMEQTYRIPDKLLSAVSLTESGRSTIRGLVAWPWTINVEGKGHYFPTKTAAIQAVRRFQKKGFKSIDVGCMQINLMHHPDAFKNLEQAFDPQTNISYGAKFLKNLKESHKNWHKAVAHYHSATPAYHIPYQKKVLKTWLEEKKKGKASPLHMTIWSPLRRHRWPTRPIGVRGGIRKLRPTPAPLTVQRVRRSPKALMSSPYRTSSQRNLPSLLMPVKKITSLKKAPSQSPSLSHP